MTAFGNMTPNYLSQWEPRRRDDGIFQREKKRGTPQLPRFKTQRCTVDQPEKPHDATATERPDRYIREIK